VSDQPVVTAEFPESAWQGVLKSYRELVGTHFEAPDSFHFAAFAAVVGTVFGRRLYVEHAGRLYLSGFYLLMGSTGSRKSTAIRQGQRILDDLSDEGVTALHGISTGEGLLAVLAKQPETRLLVVEHEFRSLVRKSQNSSNGALTPLLLRLSDHPTKADLPTRTNPLVAERPIVGLLAAATPASLQDCITQFETEGGLLNRFCIFSGEPKAPQPWPSLPNEFSWRALLKDVGRILGKYQQPTRAAIVDPAARQIWEDFYSACCERQKNATETMQVLTRRLDLHVMRHALLFAALRSDSRISGEDLTRAIEIAGYIHEVIEQVVQPLGKNPAVVLESKIEALLNERRMKRRELHQRLSGRIKARDLNQALESLIDLDRIVEMDDGFLAWTTAPYMQGFSEDGEKPRTAGNSRQAQGANGYVW
jgi:hypothetical protein